MMIVSNIAQHLVYPFLALAISHFACNGAQGTGSCHAAPLAMSPESIPPTLVLDKNIAATDASQIESLAGAGAYDSVLGGLIIQAAKWDMPQICSKDQVLVYFISDNKNSLLLADLRHVGELFLCPHIASGIMWIAKDKD